MASIFGGDASSTQLAIPNSSMSWSIGGFLASESYKNVLLYSFNFVDQDAVDVRRCFNDTTHIFAFGHDVRTSVLEVHLLLLFHICQSTGEAKIGDLRNTYNNNRIYKSTDSPINVTIGDWTEKCYLIGMTLGSVNPTTNSCIVTYSFLVSQET
jgi:hypothetical protein